MAFTQVTVTGSYGAGATGKLIFTLTAAMSNVGQQALAQPTTAELDANGDISIELAANDDAATVPQGISWGVTELIDGAQPVDFFIMVPSAAPGGTIDISKLRPGETGWS